MNESILLECANCRQEHQLPDNISITRINDEMDEFYKRHKTRIGSTWCKKNHIFVRTVKA